MLWTRKNIKIDMQQTFHQRRKLEWSPPGGQWLNLLTKVMMIDEFYITVSENYYIINDDMMN
jgi:hypothetical protein